MINKKIILISLIIFQNTMCVFSATAHGESFEFVNTNSLGGSERDNFNSVISTPDGGFIVVGYTESTDIEGITNKGDYDSIIAKYNSNGNQQWVKSFGGNEGDSFNSVISTHDGGFVAVGYSRSTDIDGITNKGSTDSIIVKYDKDGNQQWVKSFGGSSWDRFLYGAQTMDDGFVAVGYIESTDIEGITNKGSEDAIIVKYDKDGNQQWVKSFGGSKEDSFNSIISTPDGGFVSVGSSYSTDIEGIVNKGIEDSIIVKYDSNGNQQWVKYFGGSEEDNFNSIIRTSDGGFVSVGSSYSTDIEGIVNKGIEDSIIVKYDSNGNQQWVKSFGGSSWDRFLYGAQTMDDGFVAVGYIESTDIEGITNNGYIDAIIVKYDSNGNQQWVKSFGGNSYDYFSSITQIVDGKIVAIGCSESTDIKGITNKGIEDAIIVRYIDTMYIAPIERLNTTYTLDLQIIADNSLEMSISTNKISFEGYNGVEDLNNDNLNLTVSSGLYYDLYATLDSEIRGTNDINAIIDKANLKIKTSDDLEYKTFTNIGEKVNLVANHKNGKDILHNINLKLLKDSSVKADTYNTNITFEVIQK